MDIKINPLHMKMCKDFENEGFKAGLGCSEMGHIIWYYQSNKFLTQFLINHPEYVEFKDEYPLNVFSNRAKSYEAVHNNPEFLSCLETIEKICKDFEKEHPYSKE